jgi:hypothetical protein
MELDIWINSRNPNYVSSRDRITPSHSKLKDMKVAKKILIVISDILLEVRNSPAQQHDFPF